MTDPEVAIYACALMNIYHDRTEKLSDVNETRIQRLLVKLFELRVDKVNPPRTVEILDHLESLILK